MSLIKDILKLENKYEIIQKKMRIADNKNQLFIRIPKDIVNALELKEGYMAKFIAMMPLPSNKEDETILMLDIERKVKPKRKMRRKK